MESDKERLDRDDCNEMEMTTDTDTEPRVGRWTRVSRSIPYCLVLCILITFVEYCSIEGYLGGSLSKIGLEYGLKNIILLLAVNGILVVLWHRLRPAMLMSCGLVMIVGIANYFVDAFRGYGIVYIDFFAVKTASNVAGDYSYALNLHFLVGILLSVVSFLLCWLAPDKYTKYWNKRAVLISLPVAAACVGFLCWINLGYSFWNDVSNLTWDHNIGMSEYGYVLYFCSNAGSAKVKMPEGYSVEKADEILSRYQDPSQTNSVLADHSGDAQSPNLIMIMNESFSDLTVLGHLTTDKPVLGYFNSLEENTIRGYVQSSVYGGYTANSEYEFLTGCTKAFLPGNPYLQYIDDYQPTVINNILAQPGYEKAIAMHPYNPSGYNRSRVYPLLGFDQFLSARDFIKPVKVRDYIGDEANYEKIEELYEQKKAGSRLCLFNVTMQNHSAYENTKYKFEDPVTMKAYSYQFEADQYLSLMKMSDEAIENLIEYFKKVDEPTMIVLFGDHQPHLPDSFYKEVLGREPDEFTEQQSMLKYKVPFIIWANYDIGEETIERTSINYLSTLMMQTAGLELTDYQRFLLDLYQKVPSVSANGYYDSTDKLHKWSEMNNDVSKLMDEYEIVQYNYMFDKKNRLDQHYVLETE